MAILVLDPTAEDRRRIRHRQECGGDRYDEVWDRVYVVAPLANNEHQYFVFQIATAIGSAIRVPDDGWVFPGCNVSDQPAKWKKNYRCPDVAVFLKSNPAEDRGSFWFGGPDFAVEIVSPKDRIRDKLGFYFAVGVRELLIVDRNPWKLGLYRNDGSALALVGVCPAKKPQTLASDVIPFQFSLANGMPRPTLLVTRTTDGQTTRI
ncbi:MAG: Uma2 family endonuclease [Gemmataceae bacterium]